LRRAVSGGVRVNGHAYGRRLRPDDTEREWVAPPPAEFRMSALVRPMGTGTAGQFGNCRTCSARVACNEAVRKFGFFADMECEMAIQPRSSEGSGRRPARQASELRDRIATTVAGEPEGMTAEEVGLALGLVRSTACSALQRLEAMGRVRRDRSRRPWRYFAVEQATGEGQLLIP
jgi:hypothetical protein